MMTDRTGWLSPNIFRNVEDTMVATYAANRLKHLTVRTGVLRFLSLKISGWKLFNYWSLVSIGSWNRSI